MDTLICGVSIGGRHDYTGIVYVQAVPPSEAELETKPEPEPKPNRTVHMDTYFPDDPRTFSEFLEFTGFQDLKGLGSGSSEGAPCHYTVRHIERLPAETAYPDIISRLKEHQYKIEHRVPTYYIVDVTEIGPLVVDYIRQGLKRYDMIIAGAFTAGARESGYDDMSFFVPKSHVVSTLQLLLQARRLHLLNTVEARALGEDLLRYRIKPGSDISGFKVGAQDDLVSALGIACSWWEITPYSVPVRMW